MQEYNFATAIECDNFIVIVQFIEIWYEYSSFKIAFSKSNTN